MRKLGVGTGFGAVAAIFAVLMLLPLSSAGSLAPPSPTPQKLGSFHESGVSLPTRLIAPGNAVVGPGELRSLGTGSTVPSPPSRPAAGSARPVTAVSHPTSPQLLSSLSGLTESGSGGYAPSDAQVAQNGSYVFEVVNEEYKVTSTNGKTVYATGTLQSIWSLNSTDSVGDPQVLYDMISKRWILTALDFTTNNVWLAASTSSSPTGSYVTYGYYVFVGTGAQFMDQPVLGVSKNFISIDTNQFNTTTFAFLGTELIVFNKAKLLANHISYQVFAWASLFSNHPARDVVSNGSGVDDLYVASTSSTSSATTLYVYEFWGSVGTLANHGYAFTIANTGVVPVAVQGGTNVSLSTGDGRVQSVSWAGGALWISYSTACTPSGDSTVRSCVRVDAITTFTMILHQDTDTAVAGMYLFYGALTALKNGLGYLMVVGYSGALQYPSIAITGQNSTDNYATYRGPVPAFSGASYDTSGRFGDYFGIQLAPTTGAKATAWGVAEYDTSSGWATESVHFGFY